MRTHLRLTAVVFSCVFFGGMAGLLGHPSIPPAHLTRETLDLVKSATSLLAVLTSLVLGLLIFSAKGTFDQLDREMRHFAALMSHLDLVLRHYGAEAGQARQTLRLLCERIIGDAWPKERGRHATIETEGVATLLERVPGELFNLAPKTDQQQILLQRALTLASDLIQSRWLLIAESVNTLPRPFVTILVTWLTVIFASYGLNAPANVTVVVVLLVCAGSVTASILLVADLLQPLDGIITLSSAPMLKALAYLKG